MGFEAAYLPEDPEGVRHVDALVVGQHEGAVAVEDRAEDLHLYRVDGPVQVQRLHDGPAVGEVRVVHQAQLAQQRGEQAVSPLSASK